MGITFVDVDVEMEALSPKGFPSTPTGLPAGSRLIVVFDVLLKTRRSIVGFSADADGERGGVGMTRGLPGRPPEPPDRTERGGPECPGIPSSFFSAMAFLCCRRRR